MSTLDGLALDEVVVRFDETELPRQLDGTSSRREVMIKPDKVTFAYKGFARKDQKSWSLKRRQLPLTPAQSMTVHMVQGKTLDDMIVDVDLEQCRQHKLTTLYVMLSRCRELAKLRILRRTGHKVLVHDRHRDRDIEHEENRLKALEKVTLNVFAMNHSDFRFAAERKRPLGSKIKTCPLPGKSRFEFLCFNCLFSLFFC